MPNTLIFGGSGKVARHLTRLLVSKGHTVHSIIRNPSQSASLESLGARPIVQSIEDSSVAELAATIRSSGADVVVWSAGAGGGSTARTKAVDNEGAIKSMDAVAEAGVKRYIMVSAIDVRDRQGKPVPDWYGEDNKKTSEGMWNAIGAYMEAKLAADTALRTGNDKRGLQYTIIRPGKLTEDKGEGNISAGKVSFGRGISREDVAATIVECLENEGTAGLAFDIVGGDRAIDEAVKKVVDAKIDTFRGYH